MNEITLLVETNHVDPPNPAEFPTPPEITTLETDSQLSQLIRYICYTQLSSVTYKNQQDVQELEQRGCLWDYHFFLLLDTNGIETLAQEQDQEKPLAEFISRNSSFFNNLKKKLGQDRRKVAFLLPIKLKYYWTLIWIRFTASKYVEINQLDSKPRQIGELSAGYKNSIKSITSYILDTDSPESLAFTFNYKMTLMEDENLSNGALLLLNTMQVIKSYTTHGFNTTLSMVEHDYRTSVRQTAEISRLYRNRERVKSPEPPNIPQREDSASLTQEQPSTADKEPPQKGRPGRKPKVDKRKGPRAARRSARTTAKALAEAIEAPAQPSSDVPSDTAETADMSLIATSPPISPNPHSSPEKDKGVVVKKQKKLTIPPVSNGDESPCYVTAENLSEIKKQIPYDPEGLKWIVETFKDKYNEIQTKFYSRWAKTVSSDETKETVRVESENDFEFPMYGPTQVEFEILNVEEVVATKCLLQKLANMKIFPNQQQMRSISNARRWINQRFRYDRTNKTVHYLRDLNVIVPDYADIPYIVIATHLHFDCLEPMLTYNHVRRNWYISRKAVDFIVAMCELCQPLSKQRPIRHK